MLSLREVQYHRHLLMIINMDQGQHQNRCSFSIIGLKASSENHLLLVQDAELMVGSMHAWALPVTLRWSSLERSRLFLIFPSQGSDPGFPHCRQMFYCLSYQGSPKSEEKVAQEKKISQKKLKKQKLWPGNKCRKKKKKNPNKSKSKKQKT